MKRTFILLIPFAMALAAAIFYYIDSPYNVILLGSCVVVSIVVGSLLRSTSSKSKGVHLEDENDD